MGLLADKSARRFANFIDEIGYFGMCLGGRCSCFWVKVRRNDAILGGESVVPHSKFIRLGGMVKHIKASP